MTKNLSLSSVIKNKFYENAVTTTDHSLPAKHIFSFTLSYEIKRCLERRSLSLHMIISAYDNLKKNRHQRTLPYFKDDVVISVRTEDGKVTSNKIANTE